MKTGYWMPMTGNRLTKRFISVWSVHFVWAIMKMRTFGVRTQ